MIRARKIVFIFTILLSRQLTIADNTTFMTWNLLGNNDWNLQALRIAKHAQVISSSNADLTAVQEVAGNINFNTLKQKTGLSGSWFDIAGNGYGIGVLWKSALGTPKIKNIKIDPVNGSSDPESRAFIIAEFSNFCFISTHFSLNATDRDNMIQKITSYADTTAKTIILAGDFNTQPTYRALVTLQNYGFKITNNLNEYTFPADRPSSLIDMILILPEKNSSKEYNVTAQGIPVAPEGVSLNEISDHLPYYASLNTIKSAPAHYTVTSESTEASTEGSFLWCLNQAEKDDSIDFCFHGTTIPIAETCTMKSITINGFNTYNNKNVIIKQISNGKSCFSLSDNITGTFKNLIFDASGILANTAIVAANGSTLNISDCVFQNINAQANNGGAARIQGAATISNSAFLNNTTAGSYGGGAICIYNAANVTVNKCSFIGNTSSANGNSGGGAIVARGTVATACNVNITNSTFANNTSGKTGGALLSSVQSSSAFTANVTAINCTFAGNQGDGAISSLTTANGTANIYLVNSLVTNNINADATAYSDLLETTGTTSGTAAIIEPHNVIYSVASSTINTTGRNCIQITDPATANIFLSSETFATDKKRPVLTNSGIQTAALIAATSIAKNAGTTTLSGYTIPTSDQLGNARPATPAVGAVECRDISTNIVYKNNTFPELTIAGRNLAIHTNQPEELIIYNIYGNVVYRKLLYTSANISLENLRKKLLIVVFAGKVLKINIL
jgi:endonuclease/exonuclease/phosphatase family metal-dependent hydrolase